MSGREVPIWELRAREVLLRQLRARRPSPAVTPDQVVCCGHDMAGHDDDGCTVGWEAADDSRASDGCPCRGKGWAS